MSIQIEKIKSALELGLDLARQEAAYVHEAYDGYMPHRHLEVDADVCEIEDAIAILVSMKE